MNRKNELTWATVSVAVVFCALLGGCADRLTLKNFSRIQVHQSTQADVRMYIGTPDDEIIDRWMYSRPERHLTVAVTFDEGIVSRKEWIDPTRWVDDEEEPVEQGDVSRTITIRQRSE